jgi:hypothetical protein
MLMVLSVLCVDAANVLHLEPCARVRKGFNNNINFSRKFMRLNTKAACNRRIDKIIATYKTPAKLAVECLRSMPFVSELAVAFIQEYRKYLEFHSTTEMLSSK